MTDISRALSNLPTFLSVVPSRQATSYFPVSSSDVLFVVCRGDDMGGLILLGPGFGPDHFPTKRCVTAKCADVE